MAQVNKIDSNISGLSYTLEENYGTLPSSPVWRALEPNSYADFGGSVTTIARVPITSSRQRKKGVTVDLDASGGFNMDMVQNNLQDILQGFMFADIYDKSVVPTTITNNSSSPHTIELPSTTNMLAGSLVQLSGFANAVNNKAVVEIVSVVEDVSFNIAAAETVVTEAAAPTGALVTIVGHQFSASEVNVVAAGAIHAHLLLSASAPTVDKLAISGGEWVYVGGDEDKHGFGSSVNNGFKRIYSLSSKTIRIDKSDGKLAAEIADSAKNIRIFFGRVLKNEAASSMIKRRTYQFERLLGAPDNTNLTQIQAEYITGAVPNEFTFNFASASKITVDLSFIGADSETIKGSVALKVGSHPGLTAVDAGGVYNTSSDFSRIKLAKIEGMNEAPTPLFAFAQELTININNNVTPNKAVGVLGNFDVSAGTFTVGGSITAYFANIEAVTVVRENQNITLDVLAVKGEAGRKYGFAIDLPLITLGDARPNVEQDQPITIPLEMNAASGAEISESLDHTLLMVFFDYLPDIADS